MVPFKYFGAGYQEPYFQMKSQPMSVKAMMIITIISRVPAILHRPTLSLHNSLLRNLLLCLILQMRKLRTKKGHINLPEVTWLTVAGCKHSCD